jgi:hypothetical protein
MEDYEKLGVFYLGRPYDMVTKKPKEGLLLYDSKDLVTHAVCVGMTGSGKTGLCIDLLEEAAVDGIPAIVIDPKGDLPNLLLTFPELRPEDFSPWINEDDAKRKNLTIEDYARQQAELWKNGLASWGQDGERINRLRKSADFAVYTPGSNAGIPVSILKSFAAPPQAIIDDSELIRDRINTTVTSLLGLLGIDADPIRSREHILMSTILNSAWRESRDLDLANLIQQIQTPPIKRVGVLDLESFYPSKGRFSLALQLNNLLAVPGFNTWLEGEALDIGNMLHTPEGKPKVSIFSIAHLNDAERMFFVSLLLNQILGWMRTQSGTNSLRAIIYMDEIFGYFPPVANPPSKAPLLTLLKQARAFGVGIVLVTQNPVDLDYKGLANTGTWFIGRLQTERDKARLLDGLEGAAANTGGKFDRQMMEQTLAGLNSRIFLMNNTHDDAPVVFESRWAMSYLRGPLTRNQIKVLMDPQKSARITTSADKVGTPSTLTQPTMARTSQIVAEGAKPKGSEKPVLPPDIAQYFIPLRSSQPANSELIYHPAIIGNGEIHFTDTKTAIDVMSNKVYQTPIIDDPIPVNWDKATEFNLTVSDLEKSAIGTARFFELPTIAGKSKNYDIWNKDFATWLYRNQKLELWKSNSYKEFSKQGESERDFRIRLQQNAREKRDQTSEQLRQKYAPRIASLQEQIRRAQQAVEREQEQAKQQKLQTAVSLGATLLGAFVGRKAISYSTLGRATTTARGVGRAIKESQDIGRAKDTVESMEQRLQQLESDFRADTDILETKIDPRTEPLDTITIRPTKSDISVKLVVLGWLPYWHSTDGKVTQAF